MAVKATPPEPSEAVLRSLLGRSYPAFESFLEQNSGLRPEWKYYGAKLGWSLKLFHGKRNLCFISPHDNHLIIGFVLGARAVDAALASALPQSVKQQIIESKTYAEGRGVRLEVRSKKDLTSAQLLLELKDTV